MNDTRTVKLVCEFEYSTVDRRDVARPRKRGKDKYPWRRDKFQMAYTLLLLLLLLVVVVVMVVVIMIIMIMMNDNIKF